jgi:hypothetical protein
MVRYYSGCGYLKKRLTRYVSSLFFVLFIEGADPLKHPWVGLAPSDGFLFGITGNSYAK